jgi:AcrR family transcriptional regulator
MEAFPEPDFRFRISRYGIDVPLVKAYIPCVMANISVPPEAADKPLRADARRNRAKVLLAARVAFGEHGREAQMDDVARRAGVGVGTVYRHFPTKEALFAALLEDTFASIAQRARASIGEGSAWESLTSILWDAGESIAADRALTEAMAVDLTHERCPGELELFDITSELMARAKADGDLRADAVVEDIPMLMCGIGSAAGRSHPCESAWRRHLEIVIDGLRARPDSRPLST